MKVKASILINMIAEEYGGDEYEVLLYGDWKENGKYQHQKILFMI